MRGVNESLQRQKLEGKENDRDLGGKGKNAERLRLKRIETLRRKKK